MKKKRQLKKKKPTAKGDVCTHPSCKKRPSSAQIVNIPVETAARASHAIAHLMSGKEWSADTLDAIAQILIDAGYAIENSDVEDSDSVDTTECDECGCAIPNICRSEFNEFHAESCSLYVRPLKKVDRKKK